MPRTIQLVRVALGASAATPAAALAGVAPGTAVRFSDTTVQVSTNFTPTSAGTYRCRATYDGDANNNAVTGTCNDPQETRTVTPANPAITTVASPDVALGGVLFDQATVTGLVNPTGSDTVTFRLCGPNDATCTNAPAFTTTHGITLNATNTVGTAQSASFTPPTPGTLPGATFTMDFGDTVH